MMHVGTRRASDSVSPGTDSSSFLKRVNIITYEA